MLQRGEIKFSFLETLIELVKELLTENSLPVLTHVSHGLVGLLRSRSFNRLDIWRELILKEVVLDFTNNLTVFVLFLILICTTCTLFDLGFLPFWECED